MTLVGLDTETCLIERGCLAPELACVSVATGTQSVVIDWRDVCVPDLVPFAYTRTVVGHNIAYDMAVLLAHDPRVAQQIFDAYARGQIVDTMIAQRMIDIALGTMLPSSSFSLARVAEMWGHGEIEKDEWRLRYGELRKSPIAEWPQGAIDYARKDAELPRALLLQMRDQFEQPSAHPGIFANLGEHCYTAFCLHLISCWGIHTDPTAVETFRAKVRDEIDRAKEVLLQHDLLKLKKDGQGYSRDTKRAQIYMGRVCEQLDIAPKTTPAGALALDKDACEQTGDPVLAAYATWTGQNTLLKRLDILAQGHTFPLQSWYVNPLETGRSSCRHPRNGLIGDQLQNAPRVAGYRECYVPRPGTVFVIADFGGMELATIAQVCLWTVGRSVLAELLNAHYDPHSWLGARIIGASYEDVVRAKKEGGPDRLVRARQTGKVGWFSFWGMAGAKRVRAAARVQYGVHMTLHEAVELKALVFREVPELAAYHAYVSAGLVREDDLIRSLRAVPGGGCAPGDYRGGCTGPAAANGYFQELGAQGSNAALRALSRECYAEPGSVLYGSRPVLWFHDEAVWESPIKWGHECAMRGKAVMDPAFRARVPDVHCEVEPVLAACWSKKAVPVWEKGRLVPWTKTK